MITYKKKKKLIFLNELLKKKKKNLICVRINVVVPPSMIVSRDQRKEALLYQAAYRECHFILVLFRKRSSSMPNGNVGQRIQWVSDTFIGERDWRPYCPSLSLIPVIFFF